MAVNYLGNFESSDSAYIACQRSHRYAPNASVFVQIGDYERIRTQALKYLMDLLCDIHLGTGSGNVLRNLKGSSLLAPTLLDLGGAIGLVNFLVREALFDQGNEIVCLN